MSSRALSLLLLLLPQACTLPDPADSPLVVAGLRFSPSAFDSFARNAELRYALASPAEVSIAIVRTGQAGEPQLVKTLCQGLRESRGSHAHAWLGDTDQGRFAPAGEYTGVVTVCSQRFEATVRVFHY
jgi:hypothetical protein